MLRYPISLTPDNNGTTLVGFPDFPEAHTFGETKDEAVTRAVDALETIIEGYMRARRDIPVPSATTGLSVTLPALVGAKVDLYTLMRAQQVNKTELARRLNVHLPQIDRLLDLRHGSKFDQLEAAANALGRCVDVVLRTGAELVATHHAMMPAITARAAKRLRKQRAEARAPLGLTTTRATGHRRLAVAGGKKK